MPKILCVDSGQSLQNARSILEQAGCDVISSDSSDHALGLLAREMVDGVVLAYEEGNLESLSLRNRINHFEPELPVLLLSGRGSAMRVSLNTLATYVHEHSLTEAMA